MNIARAAVACLLLLSASSRAAEIRGVCDLRFLGTSTLHDFSGTVRCLPFSAKMAEGPNGTRVVPSVEVEFPVDEMDTGNGDRDAQMRKMFRADKYPRIRGTVRNLDVGAFRAAMARRGRAMLDLSLRIRDVERKIPVTATNLREEGSRVEFDVEFPVSLKGFNLEAPTVFFFIRVGDRVEVKGNVRLEIVT